MNDSPDPIPLEIEYGNMTFDGCRRDTARQPVTVPPFTKQMIAARFQKGSHDPLAGIYYAAPLNQVAIIPATLRLADYRTLQLTRPTLTVSDIRVAGDAISFTVSSDAYVHAVHFGFDDRVHLSDEYFDLLPGESRRITAILNGASLDPQNIRAGHAGQPAPAPHVEQ